MSRDKIEVVNLSSLLLVDLGSARPAGLWSVFLLGIFRKYLSSQFLLDPGLIFIYPCAWYMIWKGKQNLEGSPGITWDNMVEILIFSTFTFLDFYQPSSNRLKFEQSFEGDRFNINLLEYAIPATLSQKSGSISLFLYFSNMINQICLKFLTVFLTTWLKYFLKTFGFFWFFLRGSHSLSARRASS